jgi:DNA-binding SARP family transcriptional activator
MGSPILSIRLLGALDLRYGEAPLPALESARAESLLAYLLLHREAPQPRQRLAFLLWPDSTEQQARTNLRHVLHNLRRALPESDRFLDVRPRTLQWRADDTFWLDVAAFEDAVARAERSAGEADLAAMREAVEVYAGDLLDGCYDEWLLGERERLRQRYLRALERLTALLEARGDSVQAIVYAERLLRHDPLHEETYRLLMRLHDAQGDRARALRIYHVCAATLERELGIEPSAQTREAYEALLPVEREPVDEPQRAHVRGPSLVGRASERMQLATLWRATERGRSQLVLVTGEPGVGKTRLAEEFRVWCAHRGALTAEARSYAAEGALAYGPVVAWLRSEALTARIARLDPVYRVELARLLPELRTDVPGLAAPDPLSESEQRQRLFDALARAFLAAAGPLLLVANDLQWCDRETLQFLHYLVRHAPDAGVLVAATARREDLDHQHPLRDLITGLHALERFTEIPLERLTREETAALVRQLMRAPFEEAEVDQLYRETEGNPLFVVEAVRAGWRSGQAGHRWTSPKVQAVLESRLGQLAEPAQELVGVAATIGREFTADALAAASGADEHTLVRGLDELWRRRIIREQGADAYDFSHDKIREAAYLALSPARQRHHHLRVAHALEQLYAHDFGPVSGQIAGHYEQAGAASQAVTWYQRAAEAAQHLHANIEAARLLDRALDIIRTQPATPERDARELEILIMLSGLIGVVEGLGSSRLADAQRRAIDLTQALGVDAAPPLLRSLALTSLSNNDFETARAVGLQLHARGERDADDVLLVEGEYVLGIAAFWQGELEVARRRFEAAVDGYRSEHHRAHLIRYGQDPKVICLSRLGNTLWFLGRPESALRMCAAALALADDIRHPFSRATALVFAALLALDMRNPEAFRECVSALQTACSEHDPRQILVAAEAYTGLIDVLNGRKESGIARIQRALADSHGTQHSPGQHAMVMRVLLEAYAAAGDTQAGLAAADHALAMGGARLWEAEVRRLRAEFLAALGASVQDVEMELERALEIAHRQQARIFELRTRVSLLRYQVEHGDSPGVSAARDALAALVEALPEGRDTPDVRAAITLLGQC